MKKNNTLFYLFIGIVFVSSSCSIFEFDKKKKAEMRLELVEISKVYILKNYPQSIDVFELDVVITEEVNRWKVTFELPVLWLGGVPVIFISKETMEIVEAYHSQ